MKRKHFLFTFILALTNGLLSCSQGKKETGEGEVVTWKMATTWDTTLLPTIYGGAEEICKTVEKLTAGKFTIEIQQEPDGRKAEQLFEEVSNQKIDCAHTASFYYGEKEPALYFASSIPFGLTPQQHNAWIYEGGGIDLIRKAYDQFNIINFPAGNTGSQMGGWFNRKINKLSDLQGLKMRIPGLGALVMQELGVETQPLIPSEIYSELEKGNIDAAEFIGPHDDLKLGLDKVTKFYYFPGWWEPSTALDLLVNKDSWEALKSEYQEALKNACIEVNLMMLAKYDVLNVKAMGEFFNEKVVSDNNQGQSLAFEGFEKFSPKILEEALKTTHDILDELSKKNSLFKEIKENWLEFGKIQKGWDNITNIPLSVIQDSQNKSK